MSDALILDNVTIGYRHRDRDHVVAAGLSARLPAGHLACLLGPNGAGKSTLMRTIAGMQPPLGGDIRIVGDRLEDLTAREIARRLSVVLTDRVDAWMLTAYTLVTLGRHPHTDWTGRLDARDHERVREALEAVGAATLAQRVVGELSDGERQKVMLARALAQDAPLILLDEITAFLDLPRRVEIMHLLQRLAHTSGHALLLSTHDLDLALRTADSIWLLPRNESLTVGVPEELVLSGRLESAFASEGVTFDARAGTFRIQRAHRGLTVVAGDGVTAQWTARALERVGFEVVSDYRGASVRVEVVNAGTNGFSEWRLSREQHTVVVSSLADALRWLLQPSDADAGSDAPSRVPGTAATDSTRVSSACSTPRPPSR